MSTDTILVSVGIFEDNLSPSYDTVIVPLTTAITALTEALNDIPEKHRDNAVIRFWASGDYASAYVKVEYERPESDDERRARERHDLHTKDEAEARERAYYAQLKAKYG